MARLADARIPELEAERGSPSAGEIS